VGWSLLRIAGWFLVGLLTAVNILAMISSLVPLLLISVPVTVLVARSLDRSGDDGAARWAIAAGIAAAPLWLAWNNRHGPGTYCHSIGTPRYPGTECGDQWDPRPFALAAVALLGAAVLGPVIERCRRRHAPSGYSP
jgi:hypothetical protein